MPRYNPKSRHYMKMKDFHKIQFSRQFLMCALVIFPFWAVLNSNIAFLSYFLCLVSYFELSHSDSGISQMHILVCGTDCAKEFVSKKIHTPWPWCHRMCIQIKRVFKHQTLSYSLSLYNHTVKPVQSGHLRGQIICTF